MEESLKMSRFKHPHVVGLIGVYLDAGPAPYIVMPYMANGCLLDYLKKERSDLILTGYDEVGQFYKEEYSNIFLLPVYRCRKYKSD